MTLEFEARAIPVRPEVRLPVYYNGPQLGATYRVDFFCFDTIVVELKALASIGGQEAAQLLNYLKATGCHLGLLLNFGSRMLEYRRVVHGLSRWAIRVIPLKTASSADPSVSSADRRGTEDSVHADGGNARPAE